MVLNLAQNVTGILLSEKEPVYAIGLNGGEIPASLVSIPEFLNNPVRHFFFMNPMWSFTSLGFKRAVIDSVNKAVVDFPQHTYVMLVNDVLDLNIRENIDPRVRIHVCGEHSLTDVDKFKVSDRGYRNFDAVYIAANHPYKRIELALGVGALCLISKGMSADSLDLLEGVNPHIFCPNIEARAYRVLGVGEVAEYLCDAHCGLILSDYEGQNRATVEYLLSGLPVVTTMNRGGRDRFLTPANSVYVESNPEAVAEGVRYVMKGSFDANHIAAMARESVRQDLLRFSYLVDLTLEEFGRNPIALHNERLPHHGFSVSNSLAEHFKNQQRFLENLSVD